VTDIKKIIAEEEEKRRPTEAKKRQSFRDSPIHSLAVAYSMKAKKISSFASSVLQSFGRETGWKFEYRGTKDDYKTPCLAYYHGYKGDGIHRRAKPLIIGHGEYVGANMHSAGYVLKIDYTEYGSDETQDEINEEWFIRILAKEFPKYITR
jgi:hypothetical protein